MLVRCLDRQAHLLQEFEELGGAYYEGRVRSTLHSLGFSDADFELPVAVLSGGQKKLLGLAKLMIIQPDLLLLDEPDNHLDLAGKAFLEQFISNYPGAVVLVSHDRYLLDMVVDEIIEMEDGRLHQYAGNYSEYVFEKQARMLRQQQLFQAQQKEITRLEQAAKRLMMWGQVYDNHKFSRRGKSILKRLEKIERIDQPVIERRRMALELAGWRGSNKVLDIVALYKSFPSLSDGEMGGDNGDRIVLAGLNLLVWHGERVGVIGPNGAGKSVLFRLILGEEVPTLGEVKIGPSVTIGYYAQEHETLEYERTLIDTVRQAAKLSEDGAVRFLGRFLFSYEQSRGYVGNLSGGERARLQMALMMLSGANFLLLDEPTNNLDIASAEVLEDVLADFEGTVLVISHDRYFLDRVVDRIVELDEGSLSEYLGGYSAYQAARLANQITP
jgi:ATP-binding cassette subfamily F protein 3